MKEMTKIEKKRCELSVLERVIEAVRDIQREYSDTAADEDELYGISLEESHGIASRINSLKAVYCATLLNLLEERI